MASCEDCKKTLGLFSRKCSCFKCSKIFCSVCADYSLIRKENPQVFCKSCFISEVPLDFKVKFETIGREKGTAPTIVLIHGGGGSRTMFRPHAKVWAKKYHCILLDLPGHGTMMDEPLTIDSAIETIVKITKQEGAIFNGIKPVILGGSLGGYISSAVIERHPEMFSGAIIMMAGQTVGVGRGWAAWAGLQSFGIVGAMSASTMLGMMAGAAKKNGRITEGEMYESGLGGGFYFHQAAAQVKILWDSNPVAGFKKFQPKPVLVLDGSMDFHDNHTRMAPFSKIKLYDGADHFFTHDSKYSETFLADVEEFMDNLRPE